MSIKDAVDFHSDIATAFNNKYKTNPDFIERYEVWTNILNAIVKPNMKVVDIGCGSGVLSFFLASKGCSVIGIDGADNMIDICKKTREEKNIENVDFYQHYLPLENIPKEWQNRDIVMASSVLEYIEDIEGVLQNFKNLVRPDGGYLILSMPNAQCWYRILEKWSYRLFRRPQYYSYVRYTKTLKEFEKMLSKHNFKLKNHIYYGGNNTIFKILRSILPIHLTTNLFVAVFEFNSKNELIKHI